MARPREFKTDVALERVMHVFWAKGYEGTSLDDLCEATSVNRSSLYAAFGSKRELFLLAVDRYTDFAVARNKAALARPLPLREALAAFLDDFISQIVTGPGRRGCFIGNCVAELAARDRRAALRVKKNLARVEATFREAFERGRLNGELPPTVDVDALAHFFTAGVQGLRLVGKTNPDRKVLRDIADTMLQCCVSPGRADYGRPSHR